MYITVTLPAYLFVTEGTKGKCSEETSQGNPANKTMYTISIIPRILMLVETISNIPNKKTKLVAYAGDLSAVGCITEINVW